MKRRTLGVLVAALAVGAAGCGGSNELTRAEFVRQANAICKQNRIGDARFVSASSKGARASGDAMAQFVLAIVERDEAKVKRLAEVEPPAALKAKYTTYLASLRALNETQREVVRLAPPSATGDIAPGTQAAEISHRRVGMAHDAVHQAEALGFKYCGA